MAFQRYPLQLAVVDLRVIANRLELHRKWAEKYLDLATDPTEQATRLAVLTEVNEICQYVLPIVQQAEDKMIQDANEKVMRMK